LHGEDELRKTLDDVLIRGTISFFANEVRLLKKLRSYLTASKGICYRWNEYRKIL